MFIPLLFVTQLTSSSLLQYFEYVFISSQRAMSVAEITEPMTYENNIPKDGGLLGMLNVASVRIVSCTPLAFLTPVPFLYATLDLRMGTTEKNFKCKTCGCDLSECPGHFGHLELAKPCLHVGFVPQILKVLRCVCFHCSKLLVGQVST